MVGGFAEEFFQGDALAAYEQFFGYGKSFAERIQAGKTCLLMMTFHFNCAEQSTECFHNSLFHNRLHVYSVR